MTDKMEDQPSQPGAVESEIGGYSVETEGDQNVEISQEERNRYITPMKMSSTEFCIGDSFEPESPVDIGSAKQFEYGPITTPNDIRVLFVLPVDDPADPLECVLVHEELCKAQYQALSYTWGDSSKMCKFLCNGMVHHITENLHSALIAIRETVRRNAISPVWADAICINQADLKERESQVKIMKDIYKSAFITVVWLGGTKEQSAKVFDTMDMLHEACQNPSFQELLQRDELDFGVLDHISLGDTKLQVPWDNRKELGIFFSRPWFERIWICQEVAMSEETFVHYGGRIRPWSYCVSTAYCMQQLHWKHSQRGSFYLNALQIDGYRVGARNGSGLGLLELLTGSRQFRSTEPLDRVFGLYGLIGDAEEKKMLDSFFEYQLSPLDVFLNITLNLIISHQTLDVLHLANN